MGLGKTYSTQYLLDSNNNSGAANEVLISTSTGINWTDVSDIIGGPYLPLAGGTMTGINGVLMPDNFKLKFGDAITPDLEIYHDGSNSYIKDNGTGNLRIRSTSLRLENTDSSNMVVANGGDSVSIYYNGSKKFETTSTGVTITGTSIHTGIEIESTSPQILFDETDVTANWRNRVSGGSYRVQYASDGSTFTDYVSLGANAFTLEKDTTFTEQAFSAATSSGDASSTLTTKGYVDSLITGATIYRGTWDPDVSLNSGYGNPNLNTVTQTSGYYYICSADGAATPNGTGTEPDSWNTGDWVIWNDDIGASGEWQKIDNSSVLSGVGTGQTVALWQGASSVTDSETLGNAPITVSGNDTSFAGDIDLTAGQLELRGDVALDHDGSSLYVKAPSSIYLLPGNVNKGNISAAGLLTIEGGGTFAGSITTNLSSEGTYFTGGSGGIRQLSITSGTNTSAHALHTFNIASSNGKYEFDVDGTTELSLDSSNATFTGDVMPFTDSTNDIGSNLVRWCNV
jgi:hypothetical protein